MFKSKRATKIYAIALVAFSYGAMKMPIPPPPDMWANTGAPGEGTCYGCHNQYPLNAPGGYLKINVTPPFNNNTYIPGQNYMVTETFTRPPLTGYQCSTEIIDSLGQNAGTMVVTDSVNTTIQTAPSGRSCLWAGFNNSDTLIYCNFAWTAPLNGRASIYAAGVAGNNGAITAGGYVNTDSIVNLEPGIATRLTDIQFGKTITLFPDPAHNTLHIKTSGEEKLLRYTITGIGAQVIKTGNMSNGFIDINDLPAGAYWLQFSTSVGKTQPLPFIKQ